MKKVAKAIIHEDDEFLLQLRDDDPSISYPNCWSFFGGEIEQGESPWQALQRELDEEIEWRPKQGSFLYRWNNPEDFCCVHFFAVPFTGSRHQLVLHEGQSFGWFTLQEIEHKDLVATNTKQHLKRTSCLGIMLNAPKLNNKHKQKE